MAQAGVECLQCKRRFSFDALALLDVQTLICGYCYAAMQAQPHELSCFGKPTVEFASGKKLLGYNENAKECQHYCPDRCICALIVGEK